MPRGWKWGADDVSHTKGLDIFCFPGGSWHGVSGIETSERFEFYILIFVLEFIYDNYFIFCMFVYRSASCVTIL